MPKIYVRQIGVQIYTEKSENATHIFQLKYSSFFFFRNKMKSHMNFSFLWLSLARNTCTVQVVTRRKTFYFTKKVLK